MEAVKPENVSVLKDWYKENHQNLPVGTILVQNFSNMFDRTYAVNEDCLDTASKQVILKSLKLLKEYHNKLTKQLTSTNEGINNLQKGNSNMDSLFGFMDNTEYISGLKEEKKS